MKKTYMSPSMEVIEINTKSMIMDMSMPFDSSDANAVNTTEEGVGGQLGRDDNSSNLWDQMW